VKKTSEERILEDPDDQKKVMPKWKFMRATLVKDAQVVQSTMLKAKASIETSSPFTFCLMAEIRARMI
jgi:hypothetical protein